SDDRCGAVLRAAAAVLRHRRVAGHTCRLRRVVHQLLHLQRPLRPLSRGSVRAARASRQGARQGTAGASCAHLRRQRLVAPAVVVIGGAEIFNQWMPHADRLEITEVHKRIDGEVRFEPDLSGFEETARVLNRATDGDSADYSYVTWRRKPRN